MYYFHRILNPEDEHKADPKPEIKNPNHTPRPVKTPMKRMNSAVKNNSNHNNSVNNSNSVNAIKDGK